MEDANQAKFILVQSRIMTGYSGSDASHKVCHLHSQFQIQNGPSGTISLMGIWKLKPIYTNPGHNNETQGTGTPTP